MLHSVWLNSARNLTSHTIPAVRRPRIDVQQLPWPVQILHLASMEQPVLQRNRSSRGAKYLNLPLWARACSHTLRRSKQDALDNLCNSVRVVGIGNGHLIHGWWVYPLPVNQWFSGGSNG